MTPDFGVWVEGMQDSEKGTFLAHGSEGIMKDIWQHNRKDTNEVNRLICPWPLACRILYILHLIVCGLRQPKKANFLYAKVSL
jgi:hypothetical protein